MIDSSILLIRLCYLIGFMRIEDERGEYSEEEVDEAGLICVGPFRFEGFVSPLLQRRLKYLYRNFKGKVETLRICMYWLNQKVVGCKN